MPFLAGDRVEVRAASTHAWNPGVVINDDEACVLVKLDVPVSADAWTGTTRRYGGTEVVGDFGTPIIVHKQANSVAPGELIRDEV